MSKPSAPHISLREASEQLNAVEEGPHAPLQVVCTGSKRTLADIVYLNREFNLNLEIPLTKFIIT